MKYSKLAILLAKKLNKEFGIVISEPFIHRTYCGHWQRSLGAWSWSIKDDNWIEYGSAETVKNIIKAKHLSQGARDTEIYIKNI